MKKLAVMMAFWASLAVAHEYQVGELIVEHPWARATMSGAKVAGAFAKIENPTDQADRVVAASSPVAGKVELHTMKVVDGVMKMTKLDAIDVPAKGKQELKPGSFHVMMFELKQALKEGESFPLTLTFEHAGEVTLKVKVQAPDSMKAGH
ncbi:copper chaperone PCu(A)C [Chitinibacteraceae bacterium HSL-7]